MMKNGQHVVVQDYQLYNRLNVIQSGTVNWKPTGDRVLVFLSFTCD